MRSGRSLEASVSKNKMKKTVLKREQRKQRGLEWGKGGSVRDVKKGIGSE